MVSSIASLSKMNPKICVNISIFFLFFYTAFLRGIEQNDFRFHHFVKRVEGEEELNTMIEKRREEILIMKNHWKQKNLSFPFREEVDQLLKEGKLQRSESGLGAAYYLMDAEGTPRYVIKPVDEEIFCLNNQKGYASPFTQPCFRVRKAIPLYRTAQAEALCSAIANLLGWNHLVPRTYIGILSHKEFFNSHEKLCSIQVYLEKMKNLSEFIEELLEQDFFKKEINSLISQENFEQLCFLIWLFYDTDAHPGNFYVKTNEEGKACLIKLDNALTFPDKNCGLLNTLQFLPHARNTPSEQLRTRVKDLPLKKIIEQFTIYEMEDALEAFLERVKIIQELFADPTLTFSEIQEYLVSLEPVS